MSPRFAVIPKQLKDFPSVEIFFDKMMKDHFVIINGKFHGVRLKDGEFVLNEPVQNET